MAGNALFLIAMIGSVVFAYAWGIGTGFALGKAEQWVNGVASGRARDRMRSASGRLAAGINDEYDLGYSEGFTDADLLRKAESQ